ncbi:MAG: hypothetical protein JSV88_20605 [Candidatus Aminicenantes bacterium]|nr:MAG: hypothetical protein JSV88_20605 [Candidatus Aminicenantes bacterium]
MRKMVLFIFLVLSLLSLNVFALKYKMNPYLNAHSKELDILTIGLGVDILFRDFNGFYMEYIYTTSVNPEFNDIKMPSIFRGFHLSAGMKWLLPLIRPSPSSKFNFSAQGGVRYIGGYVRVFEEIRVAKASSLTVGGSLIFWHKKNGIMLKVMKDFSGKGKNFDGKKINIFKGIRFILTGVRRF